MQGNSLIEFFVVLKILYLSVLIFSTFSIPWNEEEGNFFIVISFLLIKGFVNFQSHNVQTEVFLVKPTTSFTHLSLLSITVTQKLGCIGKWLSFLVKQRTVFLKVFKKKTKIPFCPHCVSCRSITFAVKFKQRFYLVV